MNAIQMQRPLWALSGLLCAAAAFAVMPGAGEAVPVSAVMAEAGAAPLVSPGSPTDELVRLHRAATGHYVMPAMADQRVLCCGDVRAAR